jgi:hypothetical protein
VIKPKTKLGRFNGTTSRTLLVMEGVEGIDNPRE